MMHSQRGVTLIELVISMVIIGIAVVGILKVMEVTTRHSADPMIQHQAVAVAEAYLEEILTKSYSVQPGSGSRDNFDDVADYDGLTDSPPTDQNGNAIGLIGYTVTVDVGAPAALDGVMARRIDVTVTHSTLVDITLTGYRTSY
jgi:prepilin-type N-terminal cleavage/methylation domain